MISLVMRYCAITGEPIHKSNFHKILMRLHPELADKLTIEMVIPSDGDSRSGESNL